MSQTAPSSPSVPSSQPAVAIISNSIPPYRLHLHRRIVRLIPEIQLLTLLSHEDKRFSYALPEEIRPVALGPLKHFGEQDQLDKTFARWRAGGRMIDWLKERRVRAVVISGYRDPAYLRVMRWCHRHGVPCFLSADSNIDGDAARGAKAVVKRALVKRVVSWCTGVMPFGSAGEKYFARYGVPAERMFRFPMEPDYQQIEDLAPAKMDEVRRRFSLVPERRRIVFSGRLVPDKRPDLLVNAFTQIAARRPEWDLLIVGSGRLEESLRQQVPPELIDRVLWTGFVSDQETMSALYRQCDVLVLPSDFEPWALVVNEAAAAGLAIVCTSVTGAARELVRDGVNGRIFPPGDLDALVSCLLEVTSPPKIDAMRAQSPQVLAQWRREGDPVDGLRKALRFAGVI